MEQRQRFLKHCMALLVTICSLISAAQDKPDLFGMDYGIDRVGSDTATGTMHYLYVFAKFPVYKKATAALGGKLSYKMRDLNDVSDTFDQTVLGLELSAFWKRKIKERYRIILYAQGGFYSDFKDLGRQDLRYAFGARYTILHTKRLKTGWGLGYSRQFFGHQINPFVSVDFKLSPRWKLSGLLPVKPRISYTVNNQLSWVNEISGNSSSYRLSAYSDHSFLRTNAWYGISRVEYVLKKHHQFSFGIGYNFRQKFMLYDDAVSNTWSILTFDLSEKAKPVQEIKTRGLKLEVAYRFLLSRTATDNRLRK